MTPFTLESKVSGCYGHIAIEETEPDADGSYLELAWENGFYEDPEKYVFVVRFLERTESLDDQDGRKYYDSCVSELFDNLYDAFRAFLIRKSQKAYYKVSGVPTLNLK